MDDLEGLNQLSLDYVIKILTEKQSEDKKNLEILTTRIANVDIILEKLKAK